MPDKPWWQTAVIYQIYPRSFADSNGDGVGDLAGITEKLDYLVELGIDALWISPFYPSPMADFGYDITDYTDVDRVFGTLSDFDNLVARAHDKGLRIILDLVPNHTSDKHPWFRASRAARDNPKRDWYIWRDPAPDGGPPNNWLSNFGGPAWTYDPPTDQYYYHAYLTDQPDLNWRNPAVHDAMIAVMKFWLARGIDGFRVDVMWHMIKDAQFRDDPINPDWVPGQNPYHKLKHTYSYDRPEVHAIVAAMRRAVDAAGDKVLIGEIYLPIEKLVTYYGAENGGAHMPFNFHLLSTPWRADAICRLIKDYEGALPEGAWPNWVLGNHDRPRIVTRIGEPQARVAAMLLLSLRGTPTLYYGDEIGLSNVAIPPDRGQDPLEKNVPGLGLGRDPVRTPMPWNSSTHGGFSTCEPWLPLNGDFATRNVARLWDQPASILSLYRRLLALRRGEPALQSGHCEAVEAVGEVLVYRRKAPDKRFLIALNLGARPQTIPIAERGILALSTHLDRRQDPIADKLVLRSNEGIIVEVIAKV